MSSTRIKIVESSILLFNKKGLANVRLQDIAEYNNISPGNLTYHFKTKKDLMEYIIYYMIRKLVEIETTQRESLKHMSLYKILRKIKKCKFKKIYVAKIPNKNIGIAINDRLKHASSK